MYMNKDFMVSPRAELDKGILLAVLFLLGLGLVQVYSSSFLFATEVYGDGLQFFIKQLAFAGLGVALLLCFAKLKWSVVFWCGVVFWGIAVVGIVATLIPELGVRVGGASRWVRLPAGQRFEPAELFKISLPFLLALILTQAPLAQIRRAKEEGNYWPKIKFLLQVIVILAPLGLLLKQPDFGSFFISFMIMFFLLFVFGLKWRYILSGLVVALPCFYFLIINVPYRYARVKAFLDPWADPMDRGFQVIQSLLSFHSGGLWGVGLGQGQGKLFFLPEAHTDFTLAVLGEETGFIGFFLVMMIYGFLIFRGMQIAAKLQQKRQQVVALGLVVAFALAVFINVGVVLGMLPTKGLTLPFLSYGGSSLLSTCIAFGLLLNLERHTKA